MEDGPRERAQNQARKSDGNRTPQNAGLGFRVYMIYRVLGFRGLGFRPTVAMTMTMTQLHQRRLTACRGEEDNEDDDDCWRCKSEHSRCRQYLLCHRDGQHGTSIRHITLPYLFLPSVDRCLSVSPLWSAFVTLNPKPYILNPKP